MKKYICVLVLICVILASCNGCLNNTADINEYGNLSNVDISSQYTIGYYGVANEYISGMQSAAEKYNVELIDLTDILYKSQFSELKYDIDGFVAEFTIDENFREKFFTYLADNDIISLEYNNTENCPNIADITLLPCQPDNLASGVSEFILKNYSMDSKILIVSVGTGTSPDLPQAHTKKLYEILEQYYSNISMITTNKYGFNDVHSIIYNSGNERPNLVFLDDRTFAENGFFETAEIDIIYNTPLDSFLCKNHRFSYFPFSPYEKGYVAIENMVKAVKGESYEKEIVLSPFYCSNMS